MKAVPKVERAGIGALIEEFVGPLIGVPLDSCRHDANAAFALAEVLLGSDRGIVGQGLDRTAAVADLPLRDRIERADRQPTRQPAGHLRGADDVARSR